MTKEDLGTLIQTFARCCANSSDGTAVPLLAEDSQWDKIEARAEQEDFINKFGGSQEDRLRDDEDRLDLGQTRFSIW